MKQGLENDLWIKLTTGDEHAFHTLYKIYADVLFSFGLKYTRNGDTVKDCIHDLFVDLHKYRFKLSHDVNIKFYLFSCLKRKIVAVLKNTSSTVELEENSETSFMVAFSVEEQIIMDESRRLLNQRLQRELNLLPVRQKEVIYLRFNSELSYDEIAELMNISVETCRTLVYRAIKHLKNKLADIPAHTILLMLFRTAK